MSGEPAAPAPACLFLDASALATLFAREAGSDAVRALHAPSAGHDLASTRLAALEVAAALARRARAGDLGAAPARAAATAALDLVEARHAVQDVTPSVARRAADLLARHPLSAAEAVTLAAATDLARGRAVVTLVSTAAALNAAARAEGLAVLDPSAPTPGEADPAGARREG